MKVLLHICCAPCSIYPVRALRDGNLDVMGFFYRHNIHPYTECLKRQETVQSYAQQIDLRVIYQEKYDLEGFIQNVVYREKDRCNYCYHDRLQTTALMAKRGKFDYFSTTLLYSKFQKHEMIKSIGESVGRSAGVPFFLRRLSQRVASGCSNVKRAANVSPALLRLYLQRKGTLLSSTWASKINRDSVG